MERADNRLVRRKAVTLLAPAGSQGAALAALQNGADAVYMGVRGWSRWVRADAGEDVIRHSLRHTLEYSKGLWLAFNSVPASQDLYRMLDCLGRFVELGAKGVILNDPGIIHLVRGRWPDLPITASVGCGLFNTQDLAFYREEGATAAVLPCGIPWEEVQALGPEREELELEVFIHGWQEPFYLGKCWLGSYIRQQPGAGRIDREERCVAVGSARRSGRCSRACRQPWTVGGEPVKLPWRLVSLGSDLGRYLQAGVTRFKIQGRDLPPEEVGQLVRHYRCLLDQQLAETIMPGNGVQP